MPTTPARMNTVTKASTVAITHTIDWMRPIGTPSVAARSARVGRGPHCDTDTRVAHEDRERGEEDRDDDEHHEVVVVEEDAADLDADVERRVDHGAGRARATEAEPARHEERERGQELRDADRRDGEDESRSAVETIDEGALDDEPQEDRGHQAREERDRVGLAGDPVRRAAVDVARQ